MKRYLAPLLAIAISFSAVPHRQQSTICKRALGYSNISVHELLIVYSYALDLADYIQYNDLNLTEAQAWEYADEMQQSAQPSLEREAKRQELVRRCFK